MKLEIGSTTITSVYETDATGLSDILPDAQPAALAEIPWLKKLLVDGEMLGLVQAFVIEHGGKLIVVDTCVGDDKDNSMVPEWAHMRSGFLERFKEAGFDPASVDYVLCTHLHMDHVGWNTYLDGGTWKPTFANARYLLVGEELDYWKAESQAPAADLAAAADEEEAAAIRFSQTQVAVYEQSVKPILDAGLAQFVDKHHILLPGLQLVPTPGHTPGHVAVQIASDGDKALITGDSFHHPAQVARPEWATVLDTDEDASTDSRRRVLEELADSATYFIGSHFLEPVAGRIVSDGASYRFDPVAPG